MNKTDIIILLVLLAISIISAIYTYEGIWSLLSVFATMLYTYSICQKNVKIYKLLGIPTEFCWLCYNIHIKSIFAIIMGMMPLISSITGYIKVIKTDKDK